MAMDALKNLTANIPDWLKRLDDLSGQIDQRQAELAAVAAAEGKGADTKSLRNKGSTESLKPKDDGNAHIGEPEDTPIGDAIPEETPVTPPAEAQNAPPTSTSPPSPTAIKQSRDAIVAARARVRAQVKKRHRSASMMSNEDASPAYRTRSMIIVYYDSYVQSFFDDLVRFVSSSRNLMRKAKMAAKVAQIKRLAEMEVPDGENNGEQRMEALPSLRYMSTRRFGGGMARPGFGPAGADQKPDIYDNLDKGLEFVQSMCEHGAHQFLRDGDCNDEITKVQKRLREVLEMAAKEAERVEREEPELAKETGELGKVRTRRPISMRREMIAGKDSPILVREDGNKLEAAEETKPAQPIDASKPLEVDPNIEADEGIEVEMEPPKLQYRSTRAMRSRGP